MNRYKVVICQKSNNGTYSVVLEANNKSEAFDAGITALLGKHRYYVQDEDGNITFGHGKIFDRRGQEYNIRYNRVFISVTEVATPPDKDNVGRLEEIRNEMLTLLNEAKSLVSSVGDDAWQRDLKYMANCDMGWIRTMNTILSQYKTYPVITMQCTISDWQHQLKNKK